MLSSTKRNNCCVAGSKGAGPRLISALKYLVPGVVLTILPKCPLCIAAYIAAATGFGISITTAADLRLLLILLCSGSLLFFAIKPLRRFIAS